MNNFLRSIRILFLLLIVWAVVQGLGIGGTLTVIALPFIFIGAVIVFLIGWLLFSVLFGHGNVKVFRYGGGQSRQGESYDQNGYGSQYGGKKEPEMVGDERENRYTREEVRQMRENTANNPDDEYEEIVDLPSSALHKEDEDK